MDKPSRLNERLTLIANLSVVVGIVFLAAELRQNTQAIQAQTRDAITEKQMEYMGWVATSRDLAGVNARGQSGMADLDSEEQQMFRLLTNAQFREWENSHYQYEAGLFTPEEFEARTQTWRYNLAYPGYREVWEGRSDTFAPNFRAEIDRILAELE